MTIHVFATTLSDTQQAMLTASRLAAVLNGTVRVIVPPAASFEIDLYRALASNIGIGAHVYLCVCRRPSDIFRTLLPNRSTVVIGGRRRSWPWRNTAERMARTLERLGHRVVTAGTPELL